MNRYRVLGYKEVGGGGKELDNCPDAVSAIASMARWSQEWSYIVVVAPNNTPIARYSMDGKGL